MNYQVSQPDWWAWVLFLALCDCHVLFFWSLLAVLSSASDGYLTHLLWLLLCWILKHNPVCRSLEFLLCDSLVSSTLLTSGFWTLSSLFFSRVQNVGSTWAPTLCAEARNSQEAGLTRRLTLFVSHQSGIIVLYCLMLSVLKIPVSYVLHFVSGGRIPGSFILPLEVEFLILYVFDCSIHISISSVWGSMLKRKLTELCHPLQILLEALILALIHCFYLFIWLWLVLAEACGV